MRRFFISPEALKQNPPAVIGPEAVHIASVLRLKPGDRIVLFDGTGCSYDTTILSVSKKRVTFQVLNHNVPSEESSTPVSIAQALLKDRKMDLLTRQFTELGIFELLPFFSDRSIPDPDKVRTETRRKRWDKIVREAMKQSRRNTPMLIGPFAPFPEIVSRGKRYDFKILFWEKETKSLAPPSIDAEKAPGSVLVVLGPEGGFSEREVGLARESGFVTASLGPLILKAETAAVAAAALLQYLFGNRSSQRFP